MADDKIASRMAYLRGRALDQLRSQPRKQPWTVRQLEKFIETATWLRYWDDVARWKVIRRQANAEPGSESEAGSA